MHRPSPEPIERPDWLGREVWPHRLRTYRDGDLTLHYLDEGPGPEPDLDPAPITDPTTNRSEVSTLVFVHAGMWSWIWGDLVSELRSRYRCLAIDFPGAGLSAGGPSDVDLSAFADLLGRWLDELHVERATFVLHDLGGIVGVTAAAARPERIDGLVAINTFAWPPDTLALRGMLRFMGGRAATLTIGNLGLIPRASSTSFGVGRHLDRSARRAFLGPYTGQPARSRAFHRAMRSAVDSPELYRRAEEALRTSLAHLPVMMVYGEKNDPFHFAGRWRSLFPDAVSHTIPGGNHFPMCDAPGDVATWIDRWYRAAPAPSYSIPCSRA